MFHVERHHKTLQSAATCPTHETLQLQEPAATVPVSQVEEDSLSLGGTS